MRCCVMMLAVSACALVGPAPRPGGVAAAARRRGAWDGDEPVRAPRPIPRHRRLAAKNRRPAQSTPLSSGARGSSTRLRIVAGAARGRRLDSPQTMLRPMMGKVREALFSTLGSLGVFAPPRRVRVLDGFCGSGSVGCEALSRGAHACTFVDVSRDACDVAARNAEACGFSGRDAVCATVEAALGDPALHADGGAAGFDIVTLTPPYEEVDYPSLLAAVAASPLVNRDGVVVVEYPVELGALPPVLGVANSLVGVRNRRYGRTVLAFYAKTPTGDVPGLAARPAEFDAFDS